MRTLALYRAFFGSAVPRRVLWRGSCRGRACTEVCSKSSVPCSISAQAEEAGCVGTWGQPGIETATVALSDAEVGRHLARLAICLYRKCGGTTAGAWGETPVALRYCAMRFISPIFERRWKEYRKTQLSSARESLGIADTARVALFCGSLYATKGVGFAIRTATILKSDPSFHLIVIGGGADEDRVIEAAKSRQWMTIKVRFTDRIARFCSNWPMLR